MTSPQMPSPRIAPHQKASPTMATRKKPTPLILIPKGPEMGPYFSEKAHGADNLASSLTTTSPTKTRMGSFSRVPSRKQSVITNVVIPTHLLHSVNGSAQFSSVGQEIKRRQSCARVDPREQFDAEAFANTQSAAVLRALGKGPKSKSRSSSISQHRRQYSRRSSGLAPSTPASRAGIDPSSMLAVPTFGSGTPGTPRTPGTPGTSGTPGSLGTPHAAGGILRKPSIVNRSETMKLQLPSGGLTVPPPAMRKKSVVTFSAATPSSEKAPSHRKRSVVTFSTPSASAYHTPMSQTPLSEIPPAVRAKSIVSYTEFKVEYEEKQDAKTFPSQDYFGDYSMKEEDDTPRSTSQSHGPLDTPGTLRPETPGKRQTGWRWGESRQSISSSTVLRDQTRRNTSINAGRMMPRRESIWVRSKSIWHDAVDTVVGGVQNVTNKMRRNTMDDIYAKAIVRHVELQRSRFFMVVFQWAIYLLMVAFVYFVFIGYPLWKGTTWWLWYAIKYKMNVKGTWAIVLALAIFYAYSPLLVFFEPDPPMPDDLEKHSATDTPGVQDTCLLIPCYKSENIIGPTLMAATRIFPPSNIFVIANGNSPTPLDETEAVCMKYGVNHVWSPVGSKIVAQFVGCYAAKGFKNALLIDDDCALPPNFPIVSDQLKDNVMCMGYTIKSVGPNSSKGTLAQQAQDMEYKLSGIQRALAGKLGSALFPHGAISLWDREFLIKTFHEHPGFSVSEDWFFGHVARELGCRTKMCTSVFIETETPNAVFFSSGGARGGFGEMTVFKQRFTRWNFFFVNGMYYNLVYILLNWRLGWHEIFTKILCFQEIYETLLYLATPLVLPVTFYVRPLFCTYLLLATFGLYFLNVIIFNEIHLRRKNERVPSLAVYVYYMPYKIVLTFINVGSCYYALFKYATYFAKRHPKVIEDERAVGVVLQLEESVDDDSILTVDSDESVGPKSGHPQNNKAGRRMTVTAIGAQTQIPASKEVDSRGFVVSSGRRMTVTTLGPRMDTAPPHLPAGARRPSVDAPAILTIGGRKFSVPTQPGMDGMRRLSSSHGGPLSSGGFGPATPRGRIMSIGEEVDDDEVDPHFVARSDSQTLPPDTPSNQSGGGRGRLFSVAEVEDDEFEDAEEELGRRSGSFMRRKSSAPKWMAELARRASGAARRKSRPGTRGAGDDVPERLLDQLADAQMKLSKNRLEVVNWSIGDIVDAIDEEEAREKKRTEESRSAV